MENLAESVGYALEFEWAKRGVPGAKVKIGGDKAKKQASKGSSKGTRVHADDARQSQLT